MARVLETVLTGRDLLSPVLAKASGSVKAYEGTVTGSNARQATAATTSAAAQSTAAGVAGTASTTGARVQQAASGQVVAANERNAATARASTQVQSTAHAKAAETATLSARAQSAAAGQLASSNSMLTGGLTPLTAGLGAVALGLGYAVFRGAAFDSSMSQVQAATMATGAEMEDLRELAVRLGADTQYSGEEAAQGITELAKAGVSTADILNGGLSGALDLAAAGQLEVGQAAEIAATQMVVFGLAGDQVSHVADLMAAGAGKAQGSVQDMALAMQYAGLPAEGLGLSIEETAGTLGLFASNGLVGERAGTAFRGMLVSMTNPAGKARETMDEMNLSFFDAQGQFIGMEGVADQLQSRLGDLTVEQRNATLATIFGNEAIGAAQALYTGGAAGVSEWTAAVDDSGYAAETAAILNDNLRGDLERMGGAFDAAMTTIGAGTQGPLRFLVQTLTSIIDAGADFLSWISNLPGPVQAAAVAFAAIYIAAGPLSSLFPTMAAQAKFVFNLIKVEAASAGGAMGLFTGTVGAARVAIGGLLTTLAPFAVVAAAVGAIARMVEVGNAAEDAQERIDELTAAYDDGRGPERYRAVASALDQVQDAAGEARARLKELRDMSAAEQFFSMDYAGDVRIATEDLEAAEDALAELTGAQDRADQSAGVLGRRYDMTRTQVEEFADAHGIDLSGSLQIVQGDFIRVADNAGLAASAIVVAADGAGTGFESFTAYAAALGLSDEATEELRKHQEELGQSFTDFVDPLGAYTGLIDAKKEAERESAQATADATADQTDSWEDYVTDVAVSFEEYEAQLIEQVTAQTEWRTNMLLLASRVSAGTLEQLELMGPAGAGLVADLVNRSSEELGRLEPLMVQATADAGTGMADELMRAQPLLRAIAAQSGQGVADAVAQQIAAGTANIGALAAQYGVVLADGINPVLVSLGRQAVIPAAPRAAPGTAGRHNQGGPIWGEGTATSDSIPAYLSNGEYVIKASSVSKYGITALDAINQGRAAGVAAFADGGIVDLGRRFQAMGARVTEHPAFGGVAMNGHGRTSLHYTGNAIDVNTRAGTSALEQSELAPMAALARSLGFRTIFMAPDHYNHLHADTGKGGSMGSAGAPAAPAVVLPKPPSTAPFTAPISTAADAAMSTAYTAATEWLATLGPATSTVSGSNVPHGEGVKGIVQAIAAQRGWGDGAQWNALDWIINHESGWNPTAQNKSSTAYGLFQFLNGTWAGTGIGKSPDPAQQARAGMNYIAGRYSNPVGAKAFWERNRWYAEGGVVEGTPGTKDNPHVRDKGGPLLPGYTFNGLNHPEMVLPFAEGGMVRAEDGSMVSSSFYNQTAGPSEGTLLASAAKRIAAGEALTSAQQAAVTARIQPAASQPGYGATTFAPVIYAQVRIGNTPLSGMVRAEINQSFDYAGSRA